MHNTTNTLQAVENTNKFLAFLRSVLDMVMLSNDTLADFERSFKQNNLPERFPLTVSELTELRNKQPN